MIAKLAVPLLALAFAGCAMALLVVIAKLQNEKERRWDEISRAAGLENEIERFKAREQCTARAVLWYAEQLTYAKQEAEGLKMGVDYLGHREDVLQDKLSAILCPRNDHVWKYGCCEKCGRVKDD